MNFLKTFITSYLIKIILNQNGQNIQLTVIMSEDNNDQQLKMSETQTIIVDNNKSQFLSSYQTYMQHTQKIGLKDLINLLISHNFHYNQYFLHLDLQIRLLSYTPNLQVLELQLQYGYFKTSVTIINIDVNSHTHNINDVQSGNFGNVYKAYARGKQYAVKCIDFNEENFQIVLKCVLGQYFIMKIAGIIGSGPQIMNLFGFDLAIFEDCIQFSMQYCDKYKYLSQCIEQELKDAVYRLHILKIIHFDIKVENICYSYSKSKYVLIDFGLSKFVSQIVGEKTMTYFRGSILYCSEQMQKHYLSQSKNYIDVYYNDIEGIRKSMISMPSNYHPQYQIVYDQTYNYQLYDIKYYLYMVSLGFVEFTLKDDKFEQKLNAHAFQVKQFIKILPNSAQIYELTRYYSKILMSGQQIPLKITDSNTIRKYYIAQNVNTVFYERYQFLMKYNFLQSIQLINNLQIDQISQLIFNQNKTKEQLFYYKLAIFIAIDYGNTTYTQKYQICLKLIPILSISESDILDCPIKTVLMQIFKYAFSQPMGNYKLASIEKLIVSIIFFEVYTQQQVISIFNQIIMIKYCLDQQLKIILKFISSLGWVEAKYTSIYHLLSLEEAIMLSLEQYLESISSIQMDIKTKNKHGMLKLVVEYRLHGSLSAIQLFENTCFKFLFNNCRQFAGQICFYAYAWLVQEQFTHKKQYSLYMVQLIQHFVGQLHKKYYNFSHLHFTLACIYFRLSSYSKLQIICSQFSRMYDKYTQYKDYKIYFYNITLLINNSNEKYEQIVQMLECYVNSNHFDQKTEFLTILMQICRSKNQRLAYQINLYLLSKIQIISILPQRSHFKYQNLHKHQSFIQYFKELSMTLFYSIKQERKNIAKIISLQIDKYIEYLSDETCLICKVKGITSILNMQAFCLYQQGKRQQSWSMYASLLYIYIRCMSTIEMLDVLCIMIRMSYANDSADVNILLTFLHQFIKQTYSYSYLLDTNSLVFLSKLYLYLYSLQQKEQLTNLIVELTILANKRISYHYSQELNSFLSLLKQSLISNEDMQLFYNNHKQIIRQVIILPDMPYICIYLINLLQFNSDEAQLMPMLRAIAQRINYLDHIAKNIILCRYYYFHSLNKDKTKRRQYFVFKMHFKYSQQKSNPKMFCPRYYRLTKMSKMKRQSKQLLKCIKRYMLNIKSI